MKKSILLFLVFVPLAFAGSYTPDSDRAKVREMTESFRKEGLLEQIIETVRERAESGDAEAQCSLGVFYRLGDGVPKNDVEAVKWYRRATEHGYAAAQNNLGFCYIKGIGVEKNSVEAVKWFRKAAEQGHTMAQCSLAICYESGVGVAKDDVEALAWIKVAQASGCQEAKNVRAAIEQAYRSDPAKLKAAEDRSKELLRQIQAHSK
jgi:hypothetical protein